MSRKKKRNNIFTYIILTLVCLFFILPFLWMVLVSLRSKVDILQPDKIFSPISFENYNSIIKDGAIIPYFKNSMIIAVVSTIISLIVGSFAAYGFARFKWKKKEDRAFWILSQRFMPAMAVVVPYFLLASGFKLLDTKILLIICYLGFNIPFTIWLMRGFIEDLPFELEESALVDGCSQLQTIRHIVFPLVLPGMVATSIFCVINSWNEFVFANYLTSINAKTVPTSVMMYLSVSGVKWGEMAATGTMAVLPVLIFAIIVQKNMIRGLSFGAVKG